MSTNISSYDFNKQTINLLSTCKFGKNWPVVYILENKDEAYVGETISASRRIGDHLDNPKRDVFSKVFVIENDMFNKSATLDIESKLIEYISADGKYVLQNSNSGLRNHDYYNKDYYKKIFEEIWVKLLEKKIAKNTIRNIENTDIFKYSPFKVLTDDQADIVDALDKKIINTKKSISIINGEPGSGKTILAVYLVKYLVSNEEKNLKIGLVLPQTSLRETVKKIFKHVKGLKANMVLGPNDVVNEKNDFDVLIIDEAHRLTQRRNLANYSTYDNACAKLGISPVGSSQLDWMLRKSKHTIFLYDENQSVKPSDVDKSVFDRLYVNADKYKLSSQLRVLAGNEFVDYIDSIFRNRNIKYRSFSGYDFVLFDNIKEMIDRIRLLNDEFGLCRIVAGYAWDWKSKDDPSKYDIVIQDQYLRWNSTIKDWINSDESINEVGCIHTVQGYDLNYVGVIIGKEIVYRDGCFQIDQNNYKDRYGKHSSISSHNMTNYIVNIYKTLLTRGIHGSFVFAYDDELRKYLKKYIRTFNDNDFMMVAEERTEYKP